MMPVGLDPWFVLEVGLLGVQSLLVGWSVRLWRHTGLPFWGWMSALFILFAARWGYGVLTRIAVGGEHPATILFGYAVALCGVRVLWLAQQHELHRQAEQRRVRMRMGQLWDLFNGLQRHEEGAAGRGGAH